MLNGKVEETRDRRDEKDRLLEIERLSFWQRRELLTLADALQGEVDGTTVEIEAQSDELVEVSGDIAGTLVRIETLTQRLTGDATSASNNVNAVAAATEELAASASVIEDQVGRTRDQARKAVGETQNARDIIQTLSEASTKIGDVVKLIQNIASQTNLLALNATIEAARAGEAGKGFAVVANEVKTLAGQTADATKDISEQVEEIQEVSNSVVRAIASIAEAIGAVEEYSEESTNVVSQQQEAIAEIGRNAQEAAVGTASLSEAVLEVSSEVESASGQAVTQKELAQKVHERLEDLRSRLRTAIADTKERKSTRLPRVPVDLYGMLSLESGDHAVTIRDLRRESARVLPAEGTSLPPGAEGSLSLPALGRIGITLSSEDATRATFRSSEADRIDAFMESYIAMDQPFIDVCTRTAAAISARFEQAVQANEISMEDLFDRNYREVAGSNPLQHVTAYNAFTDKVLPEFQEPVLNFDERVAFCAAVDENGYLPTHNNKYSKPQKPDDPVWNAANCRNRRIFSDRTGRAAGANKQDFLVQSYLRDMGGGTFVLMKDLTVPIKVRGRQWGNLRLGYKP
ncbi:MAG: methyl-accepting chemotaxis protein [Alphaproteobacteria bacterium]|nr:methyl-accepting chemotaxis protein [Alphaproteobacteria bacterium]